MSRSPLLLLFSLACGTSAKLTLLDPVEDSDPPDDTPATPADTDTETAEPEPPVDTTPPEPEVSPFDGASLIVVKPTPAFVDNDGNGTLSLEAWVVDAEGNRLDFPDLVWWVAETRADLYEGNQGEAPLANGVWTVIVEADLPNGDHLAAAIGGVRVQAPRTGIYAGIVDLVATINGLGVPLNSTCIGDLVFTVNGGGDRLTGDGACDLDFLTISLSLSLDYDFTGTVTDPSAQGSLTLDLGLLGVPMSWTGRFSRTHDLTGEFSGFGFSLFGYSMDFAGTFSTRRVTVLAGP